MLFRGVAAAAAAAAREEEHIATSSSTNDNGWNSTNVNTMNINDVSLEWDGTMDAKYNRHGRPGPRTITPSEAGCALSHIQLWKQLVATDDSTSLILPPHTSAKDRPHPPRTMLILEDDARFSQVRGHSRFAKVFAKAWKILPDDWGFLYLGFSGRGERVWLEEPKGEEEGRSSGEQEGGIAAHGTKDSSSTTPHDPLYNPPVRLYQPEYGYHTHAYAIKRQAAEILLQHLPVRGPIDVWLADNQWFSQPVYCAVVAGEGWQLEDGSYEGKDLVIQERRGIRNDIQHSS
jgi:GR25 family glycosyltransferase involved in LPS biosynthesis